jgi:hypothetical protein
LPLEDFLLPNENVKFQSTSEVEYANKPYQVVVTDNRLILYARRGMLFKKDDVITERLKDIQIKYKEEGLVFKKGIIEVYGKTLYKLIGKPSEMKALYQQIAPFL